MLGNIGDLEFGNGRVLGIGPSAHVMDQIISIEDSSRRHDLVIEDLKNYFLRNDSLDSLR